MSIAECVRQVPQDIWQETPSAVDLYTLTQG